MMLGKLRVPGRPTYLDNTCTGQVPIVLAVGVGGSCLHISFLTVDVMSM